MTPVSLARTCALTCAASLITLEVPELFFVALVVTAPLPLPGER
jgi:hypothetical protein